MLNADSMESSTGQHERRQRAPAREYIELTEIAILDAALSLGTLDGPGATPQAMVDEVLRSLIVRDADFARAIGRLVASDYLDVAHGDRGWTYALTRSGQQPAADWRRHLDVSEPTGPTRKLKTVRRELASRRAPVLPVMATH